MKLFLTLSAAMVLASSVMAGYSTVYVNGQAYTVYHYDGTPTPMSQGPMAITPPATAGPTGTKTGP
jgi:hypothetical protein